MRTPRYFTGQLIRLRAVEPEDLEVLYTMENYPENWDISNFTVPYSHYVLRRYIAEMECDIFADRQLRLMIVRQSDGKAVGTVDLNDFQPMHHRAEVGIAVMAGCRKQGYASEALSLLCQYAFGFLRLRQLTAHVTCSNEASHRLFQSCGFTDAGLLRQWWHIGGEFQDVYMMQRLADEDDRKKLR